MDGALWGLNLALRNRRDNVFKRAGLKEIDFTSILITEEAIENLKEINQTSNFIDFEIDGQIYDSEFDKNLGVNKRIVFRFDLHGCVYDGNRIYLRRFKPLAEKVFD